MRKVFAPLILSFWIACVGASPAHGFSFHVNGGASVPTGDNAKAWDMGYSIRGWGYNHLTPNLLLGLGMDVNWYSLDNMGIVLGDSYGVDWDNSGYMFMIEIGPTLRLQSSQAETKAVSFFGEAGMSFFRMSQSGTVRASNGYSSDSFSFAYDDNDIGLSLGGGMTLGTGATRFEILPMIHLPFDNDPYFTLTGGIVFGR
ncbi:MAG: hypothetical protein ACYC9O_03640 [Candidatus Latescibacterota bacterium]